MTATLPNRQYREGLVVIGLFLRPTDNTHNWHGRCAYLVAAGDLPAQWGP